MSRDEPALVPTSHDEASEKRSSRQPLARRLATIAPSMSADTQGFWTGYRAWLVERRRALIVMLGFVLVAFCVALVLSEAPHDPFNYEPF